jgi:predicted SprT family Zn-dependent metalloprotease
MREKLYTFMQGRYGVDTLNMVLMAGSIVVLVINMFVGHFILSVIGYILWLAVVFRMFSRQIYKRNKENEKFMNLLLPYTRWKTLQQKRKQDPTHKYYRCSSCHQIVRLPRGHGTVVVTCPKCHKQFSKRT